ncbi:family 43 glycosylhydrolase [Jiangella asiatica]|uniref:PLL-like beta propeller domain-containing protein n=1 Tax=Jiangella asiatica TaxID=2530372 RepID=A0A4R5CI68_9ACTN|nr:family 43 glycosylhydrolase [Jiangella asiatica]TDD99928.1 hypothetical protein E1269_27100 [Jiangella asiatica]
MRLSRRAIVARGRAWGAVLGAALLAAALTPPESRPLDGLPAAADADLTTAGHSPGRGQVQMPLVPGVSADPAITTHDGRYYLTYNKEGFADSIVMRVASSLDGLYHAPDQVVWEGGQGPAEVRSRVGLGSWLLSWNGRWYLYGWGDDGSSVTTSIPFVLESEGDDPLGPYRFKAMFSSPAPEIGGDGHGYAASPVRVGDRLYLTQTSQGRIFLAELADPWTLATGWSPILKPGSDGWECANGRCLVEGGSAVVRDGRVALLFSAGGYESPDYCVGMAVADVGDDLRDPAAWTKSDDCVVARDDDAGVYGPASMIWFTSPDQREDWVVYHIKTTTELTGGDRVLQARPVTWRPDGTPDFGHSLPEDAFRLLPSGDPGGRFHEAEDADRTGAREVRSGAASGGRYVRIENGDSVTFSVTSNRAGTVPVYVWVRAETGQRPRLHVRVNGREPVAVAVPVGGRSEGFEAGQFATVALPLRSGANTIELTGADQVVGVDRVWIDSPLTADGAAAAQLGDRLVVLDVVDGGIEATACTDETCELLDPPPPPPERLVGHPGAVSRDGTSVDVFAIGTDGTVWQTALRDGHWSAWDDRGSPPPGVAPGGVSAAARTSDNLDIYVLGTDGRVWSTAWQAGGSWIGWFAPDQRGYGVGQVSAPSGVGRRPLQLDLASVGSDGQIWLTWWNRSWNRSYPVGAPPGGATSAPALASRDESSFDVIVRGADGNIWGAEFDDTHGWSEWVRVPGELPGGADSAPVLVADRATGTATAAVRTADSWWTATLEGTSWSPWRRLPPPARR